MNTPGPLPPPRLPPSDEGESAPGVGVLKAIHDKLDLLLAHEQLVPVVDRHRERLQDLERWRSWMRLRFVGAFFLCFGAGFVGALIGYALAPQIIQHKVTYYEQSGLESLPILR